MLLLSLRNKVFRQRRISLWLIIFTIGLFLGAVFLSGIGEDNDKSIGVNPIDPIMVLLSSFSLEEKIGEMFLFGFENARVEEWAGEFLGTKNIGGVLLLKNNIEDESKLRQMIEKLNSAKKRTDAPLFIAVDQEGGAVSRVYFAKEKTGNRKIKNEEMAQDVGLRRAVELKEFGINTNLAPVADFTEDTRSFLYERTFGGDVKTVANLEAAMIRGQKTGGIFSTAKHFPGHGVSITDSHKLMPVSNITKEELQKIHLTPFAAAIQAGVEMVMAAHLLLPNIDNAPVPFSIIFLRDILRHDLGFNGIILTDDLNMGAISNSYAIEEAVVRAIEAGVDMALIAGTREKQRVAYNALLEAARSGKISEERINASVYRILKLKYEIL